MYCGGQGCIVRWMDPVDGHGPCIVGDKGVLWGEGSVYMGMLTKLY